MEHFAARNRGIVAVRADAGDVNALVEGINKAVTALKEEHTQEIEALKKGQADVVRSDKIERIQSSIDDLEKSMNDLAVAQQSAMLNAGGQDRVVDADYTEAFNAFFKGHEVSADLRKGADDEGGFLAPVEWDRTVTDKLVEVSPIRQIAMVQTIGSAGFKKLFNLRGTGSGWVGEDDARPETNTPTFGQMTYTPGEVYAEPAATQGLLDDAEVNLEAWLASEVNTEFAKQEGAAFINGDGSNKPFGLLTYVTGAANASAHPLGAITTVNSGAASAITSDGIINLTHDLKSAFMMNARFVMNLDTMRRVRLLKDGQGNYLWQPSFQAGMPSTLAGYPITEAADMPNVAANAEPILFGDFLQGYLVVDRTGTRVLRDPFTNKPFVRFYTTKRVGGGLLNPEALRAMTIAA